MREREEEEGSVRKGREEEEVEEVEGEVVGDEEGENVPGTDTERDGEGGEER